MQLWVFFNAGAGGDGVANLFEQSSNVTSFDATAEDPVDYWRVHRFVDNSPKFYAPTPDANGCFRYNHRFDQTQNTLHPGYAHCIETGQNCVVTSHDISLDHLSASDCQSVFCKDQIKVLLTLNDHDRAGVNEAIKNLLPTLPRTKYPAIDHSKFDFVLEVERVQSDWQYVYDFSQQVGIDLHHQQYIEYQDLLKGNKTYIVNNARIEEYVSCIHNDNISYSLIEIWKYANKSIT